MSGELKANYSHPHIRRTLGWDSRYMDPYCEHVGNHCPDCVSGYHADCCICGKEI